MINLRIGNGFDFHKFTEESGNNHIPLGGFLVPSKKKIIAHSDGDVILHSLCEAMFGAMASGNIGLHFSNSDPKWKDVPSSIFVEYANEMLKNKNGRLINADFTVIAEEPKIMPFALEIKSSIASILKVEINAISVKATTTEGSGMLGRKEGIACICTALFDIQNV